MAEVKKLRFMRSRGNPSSGAIIARGACIDIPEPWASRFIADGTAVEIESKSTSDTGTKAKPTKKKNK